jgi:hypothetical protein
VAALVAKKGFLSKQTKRQWPSMKAKVPSSCNEILLWKLKESRILAKMQNKER